MFLWGVPFFAIGILVIVEWRSLGSSEWDVILTITVLAACGAIGVFLMYVAVFRENKIVDRALEWMGEGGDIVGFLFALVVAVVAIPLTVLFRALGAGRHA
ncbi:MAG: hypothetical protein AB7P24_17800 [Nitrospira sp.]